MSIGLYPRLAFIQALVFRPSWFRLVFGFPYVNLLLTTVPSLRQRWFEPFRPALVPSGLFGKFHEESYKVELQKSG